MHDAAAQLEVVCISDTHNRLPELPPGDLLIHAGDLSQSGTLSEIQATLDWLSRQPHRYKVVIAGNHELLLEPRKTPSQEERKPLDWHDIHYLEDSSVTLRFEGGRPLKIYGSPWTRKHGSWAFEYPKATDRWTGTVPNDTDILVTHTPPAAHLDIDGWGDKYLLSENKRVRPALHVYGHFHAGHGTDELVGDMLEQTYEQIVMRQHSLISPVRLTLYWVLCLCLGRSPANSILVNAAVIGGLKDEETRQSIVVTL